MEGDEIADPVLTELFCTDVVVMQVHRSPDFSRRCSLVTLSMADFFSVFHTA